MRNTALAVLAAIGLAAAAPSFASTTWALIGNTGSLATCTTGSESAPSGVGTAAAPVGMSLTGTRFFTVRVCAKDGQVITTGSSFDVYFYEAADKKWAQWSSTSLHTGGKTGAQCYELQGDSPGRAIFAGRAGGRVAVVPNGVVTDQGASGTGYLTIEILPSDVNGIPR